MSGTPTPERCPETQEVISYVTMESDAQGCYDVAKAVRWVLNNFVQLDWQKDSSASHSIHPKGEATTPKEEENNHNIQGKDKQLSKPYQTPNEI